MGQELVIKNMNDVREVLVDEIKSLRAKKSTPAAATAMFNGVGKLLQTVKLEIDYSRYIKKLSGPLSLTSGDKEE